ncbi:hypothetical protein D3C87_1464890 [compost metagenome]
MVDPQPIFYDSRGICPGCHDIFIEIIDRFIDHQLGDVISDLEEDLISDCCIAILQKILCVIITFWQTTEGISTIGACNIGPLWRGDSRWCCTHLIDPDPIF